MVVVVVVELGQIVVFVVVVEQLGLVGFVQVVESVTVAILVVGVDYFVAVVGR